MLRYNQPQVAPEDVEAIRAYLTNPETNLDLDGKSKVCRDFEAALADYTGYAYAVYTSSGATALLAAYYSIFTNFNKTITVPAITFDATWRALDFLGISYNFVDVEPPSWTAPPKTSVGVSFAGYPCVSNYVIDNAHSLYQDMNDYEDTMVSCLSFHPLKHITTAGEGGACLTNSHNTAKMIRNFVCYNEARFMYINGRGTAIGAVMGLSQLRRVDQNLHHRRRLVAKYDELLSELGVGIPASHTRHSWHLYVAQFQSLQERDVVEKALHEQDIQTRVHYWQDLPETRYPNATRYMDTCLSLPLHEGMGVGDVEVVVQRIEEAL